MISLRARAVAGAVLWAVMTIVFGLVGIGSYMNAQEQGRFSSELQEEHTQAVIAVANYGDAPENLPRALTDPGFQRPFSGSYWQVEREDGLLFVSPSLVDGLLPQPETNPGLSDLVTQQLTGPAGEPLIILSQWVTMDTGVRWHVQVAESLQTLFDEQQALRANLLRAFATISAVGIIAALIQVAVILRPLDVLRREVAARWDEEDGLDVKNYPIEVAPLVTDINGLLDRNREILQRSRRQAADLAHAVKTPSAIVRNELETLEAAGTPVTDALAALDKLDGQLKRSFARMRADDSHDAVGVFTELDTALGRMTRAFTALARNADRTFTGDFEEGLRIRMDQNDFEEVLGNLLDNALKWSQSALRLSAAMTADHVVTIVIEDDGPGIPAEEIAAALKSGHRLDTSMPGTGLGLAIVADIVAAYGGSLDLGVSEDLGGLRVELTLDHATHVHH